VRIPRPLKHLLVPIWNGGHRFAWRLGELGDAIRHRRFSSCAVCGRWGPMLYRRWVIPAKLEELWQLSPRIADALARKESLDCFWCGAKLRARRLAQVLLETFRVEGAMRPPRSVRDWVVSPLARSLRVAEINVVEGMHQALEGLPGLFYSEYRDRAAPGSIESGVRCEDLCRLTYEDASFDLILTSETLEHVPNLRVALSEIHRVLKPGGWHLFTVPLMPSVTRTFARSEIGIDGQLIHHSVPIAHPGGDAGYPVFTELGADFLDILRAAGFGAELLFGPVTDDDLAQVFRCRKGAP
jgi:SAM-dependent methyltransferase